MSAARARDPQWSPSLLGHLISPPAPLISEESLRDLGPPEKPLSTAGPCAQDGCSCPAREDAPRTNPGTPRTTRGAEGHVWGFPNGPRFPFLAGHTGSPRTRSACRRFPRRQRPALRAPLALVYMLYLDVASLISQTCRAPPDKLLGHRAWKQPLQPRGRSAPARDPAHLPWRRS